MTLAFFFQISDVNDEGEEAKNRTSPDKSKDREKDYRRQTQKVGIRVGNSGTY